MDIFNSWPSRTPNPDFFLKSNIWKTARLGYKVTVAHMHTNRKPYTQHIELPFDMLGIWFPVSVHVCMFGDLDWPLNASRGLSAIAEFLVLNSCQILQQLRLPCRCLYFTGIAYFTLLVLWRIDDKWWWWWWWSNGWMNESRSLVTATAKQLQHGESCCKGREVDTCRNFWWRCSWVHGFFCQHLISTSNAMSVLRTHTHTHTHTSVVELKI